MGGNWLLRLELFEGLYIPLTPPLPELLLLIFAAAAAATAAFIAA